MKTETEAVPMSFARLTKPGSIPSWARGFNAERATAMEVAESERLPAIIVLSAGNVDEFTSHQVTVGKLSARLLAARRPCRLVLALSDTARLDPDSLGKLLKKHFREVISNVEIALGRDALRSNVYEALAKYLIQEQEIHPDPLATVLEVQDTRKKLINPRSGRLNAIKVADALNMSTASLAKRIGKHRATINKTPDAPALQGLLRPFERILRLRAIMPKANFVAWLEAPNRHLDGRTPRELIEEGRAEVVADLAEDALTGQPS